jgi:NADH-quinone oxidoreductase subunit N
MNWSLVFIAGLPEHCLLVGILSLVAAEIYGRRPKTALWIGLAAVYAALSAAIGLSLQGYTAAPFPGQLSVAPPAFLAKAILMGLAIPVLLISREDFSDRQFHILVLSALYGGSLMVSADSFMTLFLGIELLSLPVYVLVLLAFARPQSAEAALKYLVLGGAASAMLLMGASLLYGWSGSLDVVQFARALESGNGLAIAGALFVMLSFMLKAAIVPFHAWAPDAYEGASVPVTAFMATIVKASVLLAAVRLFGNATLSPALAAVVALLPLASIVWGNLAAIRQAGLRRMIAYSSIAHAGYLFYAFLGLPGTRYEAIAFYVLAYGAMNILAFASLPPSADDATRDRLDGLKGLVHRKPWHAAMIAIAMLSLAGLPPFPGFIAKFVIFRNVIEAGWTLYAVLGLVGSYLGIYFYLRVVQYMFMSAEEPAGASRGTPGALAVGAGAICLAAGAVMALLPGWVLGLL